MPDHVSGAPAAVVDHLDDQRPPPAHHEAARRSAADDDRRGRRLGVLGHVRQQLGHDEVDASLDRGERLRIVGHVDRDGRRDGVAGRERPDGRDQPAILEQRRSHTAGEVAKLLQGVFRQAEGALEERSQRCVVRPEGPDRTRQVVLHPQQALLRSVVDVAFEATERVVLGQDRGDPRSLAVGDLPPERRGGALAEHGRRDGLVEQDETVDHERQGEQEDGADAGVEDALAREEAVGRVLGDVTGDPLQHHHVQPELVGAVRREATPEPVRRPGEGEDGPDDADRPGDGAEDELDHGGVGPVAPRASVGDDPEPAAQPAGAHRPSRPVGKGDRGPTGRAEAAQLERSESPGQQQRADEEGKPIQRMAVPIPSPSPAQLSTHVTIVTGRIATRNASSRGRSRQRRRYPPPDRAAGC
ncbi:hypothetical protein GCM10025867_16920 [Frondihabitans sucicola]|uniref:Uncharacterized protein n=1 Tax=Frondihabitans sucicola TaxID=1268041 RepID=A0ABM8GM05_9MICO|nr:hypothetical protein GCM10025867_16920 [Frondihabitans sucicola]